MLLICAGLILLFTGCSSTPDKAETVSIAKNRAAEYTEYGKRYFDQARFDQALKFYMMALDNNIAVDYKEGIVLSRDALGQTYLMLGRFAEAGSSLQAARELAARMQRNDLELRVLNSQGKLALHQGRMAQARTIFDEARELLNQAGNPPEYIRADIYHSIGSLEKADGNLQDARINLEKSIAVNRRLDRKEETAGSLYMLASVYSKLGEYVAAREYLHTALDIDKQIENTLGIADDYFALGIVNQKMGNQEDAYLHLQTALEIYAVLNRLENTLETISVLIDLADKLGRDDEADIYRRTMEEIERIAG
jgi:tetratricopeptide (TPR) repeat protein